MANLALLPTELLSLVVGHLPDRKIFLFDPVATRDLENLRLVCRRMVAIATPLLFENMVYDLKFYRKKDLNRLADFARINPELAKYVRCVQVKVPPTIGIMQSTDFIRWLRMSPEAETANKALRLRGQISEARQELDFQRIMDGTSATCQISMLLPNLRHLEHGISTYHLQAIAKIKDKNLTVNDAMFTLQQAFLWEKTNEALGLGLYIALHNVKDNVISLNSRGTPAYSCSAMFRYAKNLEHLELDLRGNLRYYFEPRRTVDKKQRFRRQLQLMKQLKTLRFGHSEHITVYDEVYHEVHFHVDDLLGNPNHPEDCCHLPRLERLELSGCTCRLNGILTFIKHHQQTLRQLILNRVSLLPYQSSPFWNDIAALCKEAVPGLTYLRFTRLVACPPNPSDSNGNNRVGVKPTPTGCRSSLEDAVTYEWMRGGAYGRDEEVVGFRCPWASEDALEGNGESMSVDSA